MPSALSPCLTLLDVVTRTYMLLSFFTQGGSLFYNAQGPDASLVEEVFLSGKDQVPNASLGKAFGYPGTQVRSDIMSATTTPRVFPHSPRGEHTTLV